MRILKIVPIVLTLLIVSATLTSCGNRAQNLKVYHNNLMKLMNTNSKDMKAMNAAMTTGDYEKAEEVRQTWADHLEKSISKAEEMPDFKGDASFKEAVIDGLKSYQVIVNEEYVALIKTRESDDPSEEANESKLLKTINQSLVKTSKALNQASADFRAKHRK